MRLSFVRLRGLGGCQPVTKTGNPLTAGSPRCMTLPRDRHACQIKNSAYARAVARVSSIVTPDGGWGELHATD